MSKALLYARVSHDPTGKGRSVESQLDECRTWAEQEGWQVISEVRDVDRSASRHAKRKREGWAEVVTAVEKGDIDILVTWEASRAQRDLAAYSDLRQLCERTQTRWAYSGNVYDLGDRSDRFRTGLDALVAEDEAGRTSERICRGVRSAAMDGRPTGRKLYGYRRTYDKATGQLLGQEPDPQQAAIVREVAKRFLAGESLRSLYRDFNERGVPTPTGKVGAWSDRQVRRLVSNPAYAGQRVHQGQVVGEASWDPIHDADAWARLQTKLSDPARQVNRNRGGTHLLTGVARCGVCGRGMQYAQDRGRPQYGCRNEGYHVVRDLKHLDAYVTAIVLERMSRPDAIEKLDDTPGPEVVEARHEIVELRRRLDEAADQYAAGALTADMLSRVEGRLRSEIAEAERRSRYVGLPSTATDLAEGDTEAVWDHMTTEQHREVLRALLSVRVYKVGRVGRKGFDPASVAIEWRV